MKTSITAKQFAEALKGHFIVDSFNKIWEFFDEPVTPTVLKNGYRIRRKFKTEDNNFVVLIHTDHHGEENIMNESCGIMTQLNSPDVKIVETIDEW